MENPRKISTIQWGWVGLILVLTVATIAWDLTRKSDFSETSALFVGLPALLAIALSLTAPAASTTGAIFKGTTIFLLLTGLVLKEGFICILMMSPIIYAIVGLFAWLVSLGQKSAQHNRLRSLLFVPLALVFSLEGTSGILSFPTTGTATARQIFDLTPMQLEAGLARKLSFDAPLPFFLGLGFPRPTQSLGEGLALGDTRSIEFDMPQHSIARFKITARGPGFARMTVLENTTAVAMWLDLQAAELRWVKVSATQTQLSWTLEFKRKLAPAWYFHPLETYGVLQAANYLLKTLVF
jgi:hypothetical protein